MPFWIQGKLEITDQPLKRIVSRMSLSSQIQTIPGADRKTRVSSDLFKS